MAGVNIFHERRRGIKENVLFLQLPGDFLQFIQGG